MAGWSYKTVPAPKRAPRGRGDAGSRLAQAMGDLIAAEAAEGWEYLRADCLPVEEGGGLFSKPATQWRAVLVFRRAAAAAPRPAFRDPVLHEPATPREPFLQVAAAAPPRDEPGLGGVTRD